VFLIAAPCAWVWRGGGEPKFLEFQCRIDLIVAEHSLIDFPLQNAIERVTCDKKKGELSRDLVYRTRKMRGACNTKARGDSRKFSPAKHGRN